MRNLVRVGVVGVFSAVLLTGCMPRGETKTLSEVLSIAQTRYTEVSKDGLPGDVSTALTSVADSLAALTSSDDLSAAPQKAAELGETIAGLVTKAGFTSRAALNEISMQYRMLGGMSGEKLTAAQVRLLASRTYSVLAAELETTRFSL